jgi:outer membrane biosynthesis protein TonB
MDRAEKAGFGAALAGHAALLAALSLGFANVMRPPVINQPMEVSFVEDIGLQNAVPEPSLEPAAASVAPELGPPEDAAPAPDAVPLPPEPAPPPPKAVEAPPEPKPAPKPVKPAPAKPSVKAAPAKPTPAKAVPAASPAKPAAAASGKAEQARGSRLGKDFLKGLGSDPASKSEKAPGTVMSAVALAGIKSAIQRQIQPCANRQVNPGPGANRIAVTLNLRLNPDGSLAARPAVVSTSGVDDENDRYQKRVGDLAVAAFTGCSPLRDLPADLYRTPKGGWSNINFTYKLP